MHNIELILTLTAGLSVALILGYLTNLVGLSPIVGYLLAGIVVSPNTPGFVADRPLAEQMAEIGVILLMFGVGMHFHIEDLLAVKKIALPGAVVQSLAATALGAVVAWFAGWGWGAGAVYGLALSVASTVVLTRVLADNNDLHTPAGHIAVGWLVVEDLFTVVVLVLLPAFFSGDGGAVNMAKGLGIAVVKIVALVTILFLAGGRIVPAILERAAASNSRELFTLTVLVIALGIAVGSSELFGVSMPLGAFLAGMIVGRSEFSLRAASEALPMRDAFAVLFFVSAGMLFRPADVLESPGVILATLGVVMLGKPLAALAIVMLFRYPLKIALAVAIALAQVGEFSFILATLGTKLGVLPDAANNAIVAAAIVSISLNPLLYRAIDPFDAWLARRPKFRAWCRARLGTRQLPPSAAPKEETDPRYRAVVVGYGPVGRTLSRLLQDNDIVPTVIEMNRDTVQHLRNEKIAAVYGDAARRETLEQAGMANADTLILSASGLKGAAEVVRLARELNPGVRVLARSAYLRERADLRRSGADEVYAGEGEVALAMTESVLRGLGASPDQIDRERGRVREELFGAPGESR